MLTYVPSAYTLISFLMYGSPSFQHDTLERSEIKAYALCLLYQLLFDTNFINFSIPNKVGLPSPILKILYPFYYLSL